MNNGSNLSFDTKPTPQKDETVNSILTAREQREKDMQEIRNNDYVNMLKFLNQQINALQKIDSLNQTQSKLLQEMKNAQEYLSNLDKEKGVRYDEFLKKETDYIALLQRSANQTYYNQQMNERDVRKRQENETAYKKTLIDIEDLHNSISEKIENNKEATKSLTTAFSKGLSDIKNSVRDIAVVGGLDEIYKTMSGGTTMLGTSNQMATQFNMTRGEFDSFRRELTTQIIANGNITRYGLKDTLDYMGKLGDLGIYSQEQAERQMDAILTGNKYLGLTTETQARLLKVARDTNNTDLLNSTNETLVQIMNANLGINKEQLDKMTENASQLAEVNNYMGGSANAIEDLVKTQTAIEKVYGKNVSEQTYSILNEILSNPASNQYLNTGMISGDYYNSIVNSAQKGDYTTAMEQIIEGIKNSNTMRTGSNNLYARNSLGITNEAMAIYNAEGKGSVEEYIKKIDKQSTNTNEYIKKFSQGVEEKITNVVSNIFSYVPFSNVLTLQNTFYTLAIAEMLGKVPNMLKGIGHGITQLVRGNKDVTAGLLGGGSATGSGSVIASLGTLTKLIGGGLIISGVASGVYDGFKALNEEKHANKVTGFLGGMLGGAGDNAGYRMLKKAGDYAMVGAGLGLFLGQPILGGILGAITGLVMGGIGGKNIESGINSFLGIKDKQANEGIGSSFNAPVTPISSPSGSHDGKGSAVEPKNFAWRLTSPFGFRGSILTKNGWTQDFHDGIDLASAGGTPIGANRGGTVVSSGTSSPDGANFVIVRDNEGFEELYWHLQQPSHLKKGDKVNAGQLIGLMGMTGLATGNHLHFGMRHSGTKNYIDPINHVNSELFYPTENGYPDITSSDDDKKNRQQSTALLQKVISADTKSDNVENSGVGSTQVVEAINLGFSGLNDKLDELSGRQDEQEQVLKSIVSGTSSRLYRI